MPEVDDEEWQAGERVGAYEVVRAVGRGGMAVVFEARHVELGGRAAIKVLRGDRGSPAIRERFLREGKAIARVRHPHVVRVFDAGEHRGAAWLLMEFVDGQSLRARLMKAPPLPVEQALDLVLPVIAAVAAAHDEGVIHRDLKPANVMLERLREGGVRPVVVDFGIARVEGPDAGRAITQQGAIVGTPAYLAPEQVTADGAVLPASDQWSTAAVLYECLVGRKAFPGDSVMDVLARVARGRFEPPRALRPELAEGLEAAILQAMAVDPARRFRTMRAFGRALLPFASERARVLWERSFVSDDDVTGVHALSAPPAIEPAPEAPSATPFASVSPVPELRASPSPAQAPALARRVAYAAAGVALMAFAAAFARCGPPRGAFHASVVTLPARATVTVDGARVPGDRFEREYAADGLAHELTVTAPGCAPHVETFVDTPPTPRVTLRCGEATPAPVAAPEPAPQVAAPPTVQVVATPPAAPAGHPHGRRPGRRGRRREAVPAGEAPADVADPPMTVGTGGTSIL